MPSTSPRFHYLLMYLWMCCSSASRTSSANRVSSVSRVSSNRPVQTCSVHSASSSLWSISASLVQDTSSQRQIHTYCRQLFTAVCHSNELPFSRLVSKGRERDLFEMHVMKERVGVRAPCSGMSTGRLKTLRLEQGTCRPEDFPATTLFCPLHREPLEPSKNPSGH